MKKKKKMGGTVLYVEDRFRGFEGTGVFRMGGPVCPGAG